MHWSNPPHIIPMIEVISGEHTVARGRDGARSSSIRRCGHLPITIRKDVPGFVENRVLYAVMRECLDLVEQGVIEPQDLDACVSWGIGYKLAVVGPMALLDMAGLDIYAAVASYLNKELSNRADVAAYVTERTAQRKLGIKTGGGIYDYTPEKIAELQRAGTQAGGGAQGAAGMTQRREDSAPAGGRWRSARWMPRRCASASAAELKALAIMMPEEPTDYGWNQQGFNAAKAVAAKYGLKFMPATGLGYGDVHCGAARAGR